MRRRVGRPSLLGTMATTAVVAGTATAVSGSVASRQHQAAATRQQQAAMQQQAAQQQMQEAAAAAVAQQAAQSAPVAAGDIVAQIQQLADLKAQGILSDAEFETAKQRLLAG